MPLYALINTETQEEFEELMSWTALQEYLAENPHMKQLLSSHNVSYKDFKKPDDGFRDILRGIKRVSPRSNIETF